MVSVRHNTSQGLPCAPSDLRQVEEIVNRSGTSFGRGMKILPPGRRDGMFAIYAFCRVVDDIADGDTPHDDPASALESWKGRIAALYEGQADTALERVLLEAIRQFGLRQDDFIAIIDGMLMDCGEPVVAPDEATLDLYCDRVASAVGRLSVRIFGTPEEQGDRLAYHLGRALQLTNILRDIAEDAARGRLYLPAELLRRYSVPTDPAEALYAVGLDGLCRILAGRAKDHFRRATALMKQCPAATVRPARIMAASYRVTLAALCRRGWRNPEAPLRVCSVRKKLAMLLAAAGVSL
ncbi:presqualene diphosphate synthase HpnD [Parasaccharibacter apium]|uniref:Squalene synthase HpnD n=1 Tax=Parasaccharibacter apium TaxID=1510841 RepID=A0ABX4ZN25_9PROT|nr:presqualene diphosphate synthase HpnD [Parasaccharibacter apium]POS63152.1 squalene synthase HpnD [Parasaccharibacter apium]POS63511.1 squalene synthase HpnD [Parasaccharibacter apium]POS64637.1 squalene synthase HpnD [Parasaccharibacter apium]